MNITEQLAYIRALPDVRDVVLTGPETPEPIPPVLNPPPLYGLTVTRNSGHKLYTAWTKEEIDGGKILEWVKS